uniref:Uncharacterized protein n=1 Tax=Alexandrium monilatum TaxID=311494 RepID=A0A7S4QX01_9DINO|mmetsp:Transcript_50330/g.150387  ORF Transcript_50330/g.150387 Transcript_50330/m.150387 type:complete len:574 (+) Transcript_50330:68-1789(+)
MGCGASASTKPYEVDLTIAGSPGGACVQGRSDAKAAPPAGMESPSFGGCAQSLVAFDVDKTVLHQGEPDEIERFLAGVGQTLANLAELGFNLAAVTGNSLSQLSSRFMQAVVQALCARRKLKCIQQFHFFCNGAAVYVHIDPARSPELADLLQRADGLEADALRAQAMACLFDESRIVRPCFLLVRYIQQCSIPDRDKGAVLEICNSEARTWWDSMGPVDGVLPQSIREAFYIATGDAEADKQLKAEAKADPVNSEASLFGPLGGAPKAATRESTAADGRQYTTSVNILPILSFRHARRQVLAPRNDPRMQVIERIRSRMRTAGLARYIVSPGGRGTIDICHHLVNKRSALVWLLRRLNIEGVEQLGEPMGVNVIYFGDEVALNGNDLPIADIPGVSVFAVNELADRVPFRTNVELPKQFSAAAGPEGTKAILDNVVMFVESRMRADGTDPWGGTSAVAAWKERRLIERVDRKVRTLTGTTPPDVMTKVTYRRLEAAAAAVTALTRRGEGLDAFAEEVLQLLNNIGMVSATVQDQQFEPLRAQGSCHEFEQTRGTRNFDHREDALMKEMSDGV